MSKNKNLSAFYKISKNDFSGVQMGQLCNSVYGLAIPTAYKKRETDDFTFLHLFSFKMPKNYLDANE
jgi:hypothetical protein